MRFSLLKISLFLSAMFMYGQVWGQNPFELKWREGKAFTEIRPEYHRDSLTIKPASDEGEMDIRQDKSREIDAPATALLDVPEITPPEVKDTIIRKTARDAPSDTGNLQEVIDRKLRENPFEVSRLISRENIKKRKAKKTEARKDIPPPPKEKKAEEEEKDPDSPVGPKPVETEQEPVSNISYLAVFACILLLLTFVVNMNRTFLNKIYRAVLNENYSSLLYRDRKFSSVMLLYYMSYAIFFINGGLFLYLIASNQGWQIAEKNSLLAFIGLVTCVYLVRHLILNILSSIFPISKELNQYNFNILLFNILLGLVLLPVNLLMAFGPEGFFPVLMIFGAASVGIFYLLRQFRGLLITNQLIAESPFHFFVYLCTIEILPILILLKFF